MTASRGMKRTPLVRKTPMPRATPRSIRHLLPHEPIPSGEPRRYKASRGYIRLRWHTGPGQYVEEYEHRIVMGRPSGDVHHINGNKADNRPENLVVLSKVEHAKLHERLAKERDPERGDPTSLRTVRGQVAAQKSERTRRRRELRDAVIAEMRQDYESGLTIKEIAAKHGVHHSNVSRALRSRGTQMRPSRGKAEDPGLRRSKQVVHARAGMDCERCSRNTTWDGGQVHHRLPRGMGGSSNPGIHDPANLLLLCSGCHAHVESYRQEAYAAGWLVRQGHDPATIPVMYRGDWVFLNTDGTTTTTKEVP